MNQNLSTKFVEISTGKSKVRFEIMGLAWLLKFSPMA